MLTSTLSRVPRAAASGGGAVLSGLVRGVALLRPADKPLHPTGEVTEARLWRRGSAHPTGAAWLDTAGEDRVQVRRSRAVGLPAPLPDVHGLALRIHGPDGFGDLLFSTTGTGRLSRFVLLPSRSPSTASMTTLLPYDTDSGPVVLCARPTGEVTYELAWARPGGDWHPFADLRLSDDSGDDVAISFDPVGHQLPGIRQFPLVRRLRAPAYGAARASRGEPADRAE